MSIRQAILALLTEQPMYGAQIRAEFEERTGGSWPLNVGQVYTTLGRLERDELVEGAGETDDEGRIAYRITAAGRRQVRQWWRSPVGQEAAPRNELVIKLALAVSLPGVDVGAVVQAQRKASLQQLQELTKLARDSGDDHDSLVWSLVLENARFTTEAELRWLDHVEGRLGRSAPPPDRQRAGDPDRTPERSARR